MKKVLLAAVTGLFLAVPAVMPVALQPFAAQAQNLKVGTIDVQKILNGSALMKALEQAQKEVMEAEKRLEDSRRGKLEELQRLQQDVIAGKMKESDFVKKREQFEKEIADMFKTEQTKMNKKKEEIRNIKEKMEKDVEAAVQKVAKEKGLDIVINKQLVLFGGVDITDAVKSNLKL